MMVRDELREEIPVIAYQDLSIRDMRSLAFHFLYAAESFDYQESLDAIVDNFNRGFDLAIPLDSDLVATVQAIIDRRDELDEVYKPFLDNWRFERVSTAVKLILRFAVWELGQQKNDPRIIINEAIELTKAFAEKDAYRFVNGILDRVAKSPQPNAPEQNLSILT
jgi:transcription antitermination protein NusB